MDNKKLKEKQKQEALKRLEILEKEYLLHKNVLKEYKADETIYYSENLGGFHQGILYWLHNRQAFVNIVKEIEEKRNIYVYHCILNYTKLGEVLTMLYISADEQNWEYERNQLQNDGFIDVCICDLSCEFYSEFASVEITGVNGGLNRVN